MRRLLILPLLTVSFLIPARVDAAPGILCPGRYVTMALLGRPTPDGALLAGSLPGHPQPASTTIRYIVRPGDTLSGLAAHFQTTVEALMVGNQLTEPNVIEAGQTLLIPTNGNVALPAPFVAVWRAGEAVQGQALLLWVEVEPGTTVRGRLDEQTIEFFPSCHLLWGLVALDAFLEPGRHLLELTAISSDRDPTTINIPIDVRPGDYETETIWLDPETTNLLDPALIRAENERLDALFVELAGPRLWSGRFHPPMTTRLTSLFGTRRSWNGQPATTYHEGLDFDGDIGDEILAAAAGRVVLAEKLTVRGNTVFLDHGAGVVTGYFHMSEIAVQPGQFVEPGELLGKVGATGLVTGPHLHWEVRVNGLWVDPTPWLERTFP